MKNPEVSPRIAYGVPEAAQLLSVSRSFILKMIRQGALPIKRAGRRVLVLRTDLEKFLEKI